MSRDDVDNRIRKASAGYVTADGHLLYVYDSTTGMTDGSAAYAADHTSLDSPSRPRVTRMDGLSNGVGSIAGDGMASTDDSDIYDSFSALFLAYDAASGDAYPAFDDEPDDDELNEDAAVDEAHAIANAWHQTHNNESWGTGFTGYSSSRHDTMPYAASSDTYDSWEDESSAADDAADIAAMNALIDAFDLAEEESFEESFDADLSASEYSTPDNAYLSDDLAAIHALVNGFDRSSGPAVDADRVPEAPDFDQDLDASYMSALTDAYGMAESDYDNEPASSVEMRTMATDDVAAMNAMMDSFDAIEGAPTFTASERADAAARRRAATDKSAARPAMRPDTRRAATPRHLQESQTRSRELKRPTVAVNEMAASSPEAQAAVDALKVRRAQARRRHGAYAFLAVGVALIAVLSVFVNYLLGLDETISATAGGMVPVWREDYVFSVKAMGSVEPIDVVEVTPSISGKVDKLYVAEGDLVKEGNVLFSVSSEKLSAAVSEASAELDRANAELTRANAAVIAAYNAYNSEVDRYRAGNNAAFDDEKFLNAISDAETRRDNAYTRADDARIALEEANDALAECDVIAPIDGAVVNLKIQEGSEVTGDMDAEGSVALAISDVSSMNVRVSLSEAQKQGVEEGQDATISLAALPDISAEAVVDSVADEADKWGNYTVNLVIYDPDSRIRPGAEVVVNITTNVEPDVIVVPAGAVHGEGDEANVWVMTDTETGRAERRKVRIGAHDDSRAVVLDGLTEGELIGLPE